MAHHSHSPVPPGERVASNFAHATKLAATCWVAGSLRSPDEFATLSYSTLPSLRASPAPPPRASSSASGSVTLRTLRTSDTSRSVSCRLGSRSRSLRANDLRILRRVGAEGHRTHSGDRGPLVRCRRCAEHVCPVSAWSGMVGNPLAAATAGTWKENERRAASARRLDRSAC